MKLLKDSHGMGVIAGMMDPRERDAVILASLMNLL